MEIYKLLKMRYQIIYILKSVLQFHSPLEENKSQIWLQGIIPKLKIAKNKSLRGWTYILYKYISYSLKVYGEQLPVSCELQVLEY